MSVTVLICALLHISKTFSPEQINHFPISIFTQNNETWKHMQLTTKYIKESKHDHHKASQLESINSFVFTYAFFFAFISKIFVTYSCLVHCTMLPLPIQQHRDEGTSLVPVSGFHHVGISLQTASAFSSV